MNQRVIPAVLALDAMGGDRSPLIVCKGAIAMLRQVPDLILHLFGVEDQIIPLVKEASLPSHLQDRLIIHNAQEVISNHMKPAAAVRLRRSSLRLAVEAVASGTAQAVVSAGNTGAYMALSKIILKTLPQVDRPALPAIMPTLKGFTLALDLGANVECSPQNLLQFGGLGRAFARQLLHQENPTVGLLNVGAEHMKGTSLIQEAAHLMQQAPHLNFYGFVEGNDITLGTTDVVVTDGFTGNIVLKSIEGTVHLLHNLLTQAFKSSLRAKVGYLMAKGALDSFRGRMDPRLYNGACFLGLRHIAIKSHGGTDEIGFANAIKIAVELVKRNFITDLQRELTYLQAG